MRPRSASPPSQAHQHHSARSAARSPPIPGSTEPRRLSRQEPHSQSSPSLHVGVGSPSPSSSTTLVSQGATCRPPPLQQRLHVGELKSNRGVGQVGVVPQVF